MRYDPSGEGMKPPGSDRLSFWAVFGDEASLGDELSLGSSFAESVDFGIAQFCDRVLEIERAHYIAEVGAIPETEHVAELVSGGMNHCAFGHLSSGRSFCSEANVSGKGVGVSSAAPVVNLALPNGVSGDFVAHCSDAWFEIDADTGLARFDFHEFDF